MSKKKIGIITICRVNNYGAELQAFALQNKLSAMDYEAEIIDYLFYKHPQYIKCKEAKPWINIGLKNKLKEFFFPILESTKNILRKNRKKVREKKFHEFHNSFTTFSKQRFYSLEQLNNFKHDYDVFMVGSDQVWNPFSNTSLDPYLLSFAECENKVSYASSFGVAQLPIGIEHKYTSQLKKFKAISVREESGVSILNSLGISATQVLDPTLLLNKNEWEDIAVKPKHDKKYILLYVLTVSDYIVTFAEKIQKETGMDIIRLCHSVVPPDSNKNVINIIDAGPSEFLGYFLDASFILTNSFHGTAFSVNFEKDFYCVLSNRKKNNSRQIDFLTQFALEKRIIFEENNQEENDLTSIDYFSVIPILEGFKKKSLYYLESSLV